MSEKESTDQRDLSVPLTKSVSALSMYALLSYDIGYFLDMLPSLDNNELDTLWFMFTTPNAKSDTNLNDLGASFLQKQFADRKRPIPKLLSTKYLVSVTIELPVQLIVMARTPSVAQERACFLAKEMSFLHQVAKKEDISTRAVRFEFLDPKDTTVKYSTYTCAGCGVQSLKEKWGPGWMFCPHCGRRSEQSDSY